KILDTAALDRYSFIRDAYLQRRRNLVFDGNPPPEPEEDLPAGEPRSEVPDLVPTVLVDSYGNLVLAPAAGPASVPPSSAASSGNGSNEAQAPVATPATATPSAAARQPADAERTSGNGDSQQPARSSMVRVWLPGGSSR